ncbi:MAG: DUF1836 domain-containing protein [Ruminococcaceae bacterium]|nr:DUF1836 domain-containing protein [Oscillospiraceae bacterium]
MDKHDFDLEALVASAVADVDLSGRDIPAIDLYLDQIITLASDRLAQNKRGEKDKLLTKTMINNYSKDGVIKPVKGKKYSREQIVQMMLVYSLKQNFSIGEIKQLFDGVYAAEGFDGDALIESYDRFLDFKAHEREACPGIVKELLASQGLDMQNDRDFFVGLLGISAMSTYLRNVAQDMLALRYPLPEKDKEKEKKEKDKEKQK